MDKSREFALTVVTGCAMAISRVFDRSFRTSGASRGIGRAIAQGLAKARASVALCSRAAVFLSAPASDYLTGQTIVLDGGFLIA